MDTNLIISIIALVTSIVAATISYEQAKQAKAALKQNEAFNRVNTIIHFTNAYQTLVKEMGVPHNGYSKEKWINYWSLLGTEFYFFRHGVIPAEMYILWIVDVAALYAEVETAWQTHKDYLNSYAYSLSEMKDFFTIIAEKSQKDEKARHEEIQVFVKDWIVKNRAYD